MIFTYKYLVFFVSALFVVGGASQEAHSQLVNKEVPYIMALWKVTQSTAVIDNTNITVNHTIFKCAGVLVSSQYALTTISCLDQIKTGIGSRVSAGPLKRGDHSRIIFHEIEEEIPHYRYNSVTKENDIALIKIRGGFAKEPKVSPIKVHRRQTPPGTMCSATGWRTSFYYWSDDLRSKTVFRLDDAACNAVITSYNSKRSDVSSSDVSSSEGVMTGGGYKPPRLNFGGRKICAADKYNEECNIGDEGGPLVCDGALAGIFSNYVLVCLQTNPEPAFYHDVTQYAAWIAAHAPGVEFH